MSKLKISDDLSLPLDLITMRTTTYGDSGAGKTAFGRLLAEKVHEANQRFCAIDLKNDWWGLKSSADGNSAGIPIVVFGGPRGDVKLFEDVAAANTLADTVASIDQSVIIDLDAMSRFKQEKFLAPFLDRLYDVNRQPILLFCDEADRYAPQKPMTETAILSLGSSEDIARRGRKRGLGSFWLTQRTAVLNKNVSEFSNLTVVFRTPGSRDLKELEERVGRIADKETVKEVLRLAPGLADGEAFFLSSHPKLRPFMPNPVRPIQLPMPWTFDSSATPGVGHRRREPKVLAQTDLAAIESKMAAQVEKVKANDPAALKKRIADLEREAKLVASRPAPVAVKENGQLDRTEKIMKRLEDQGTKMLEQGNKVLAESAELRRMIAPATAPRPVATRPMHSRTASPSRQVAIQRPAPRPQLTPATDSDGEKLPEGERMILTAVAQCQGADRQQVSVLTGYKRSTRDAYIKRLGTRGFVDVSGDQVHATQAGIDALGSDFEPLPTGEALQAYWVQRLPEGERKVFEVIIAAYPNAVPRDEVGDTTGYKRSTRDAYIKRLGTRKLLTTESGSAIRASDTLFDMATV